jgi:hypothetical protein
MSSIKDVKDLNWEEFKSAIQSLNNSKVLEKIDTPNIRVVGVKKEVMLDTFIKNVDALADANLDAEVPDDVAVFYNGLFIEDGAAGGGEEAPPEKEPEEAPEAGTEEPAPKKEKEKDPNKVAAGKKLAEAKKKTPYGHVVSAKSGQLDICLSKGCTYQEAMDSCGVNLSRVKGHIQALKKKGLTILVKEDKENPKNTFVEVEEKTL